ncbi:MAG TPA: hypothetical protein VEH84_03730 [Alphaproteobacteria bacterium]|nr:hypothetical protein [Alphaproteobacteria bacterium]
MAAAEGPEAVRGLAWAHGVLAVQRLGAMLAPLTLLLPDGRQVSPLHVAPWADEPGGEALPGILRRLRGEWPCVPFGVTQDMADFPPDWRRPAAPAEPGEMAHGASSNLEWAWIAAEPGSLALALDYPADSAVRRVTRIVRPDPVAAAVDLELRVEMRRTARLPLGLHPVLRLPVAPGAAVLEPGRFALGRTFPGRAGTAPPLFAADATFADLAAVPAAAGGTIDATRLPFDRPAEELLQLTGIDGGFALANRAEGYRVRLSWDGGHFQSVLLWLSNRGRRHPPWNGRHLALGVEPVCAAFDLGTAVSAGDNPIAAAGVPTARLLPAGEVFATRYRIGAEPL